MNPEPIDRLEFDAAALVAAHPPVWRDANKKLVYDISSPPGCVHAGRIGYTRWAAMPLPERVDAAAAVARIDVHAGVYDYDGERAAREGAIEWHVNFADPNLFGAYGSPLLAQDEWQVAEHPALGSLLEALNARGMSARTVQRGEPAPVLVSGVERRCRIATDRNAAEARPDGLYGGLFSRAAPEAVRRATRRLDPPTTSHIIAIAAPNGGFGRYSAAQIEHVLATAYTGFRAAVVESARLRSSTVPVVVHSGFWGCGVFGGNHLLMTVLQVLAAEMAGVDRLVLHTVNESRIGVIGEAREVLLEKIAREGLVDAGAVIAALEKMGFEWGVGDGN